MLNWRGRKSLSALSVWKSSMSTTKTSREHRCRGFCFSDDAKVKEKLACENKLLQIMFSKVFRGQVS